MKGKSFFLAIEPKLNKVCWDKVQKYDLFVQSICDINDYILKKQQDVSLYAEGNIT